MKRGTDADVEEGNAGVAGNSKKDRATQKKTARKNGK